MQCACYIAEGDGPLRLNPCPEHEKWAKTIRDHERDRCCQIVFGQASSDNDAQRTVNAIRGVRRKRQ